jgi:large subunit ribosomal protein L24
MKKQFSTAWKASSQPRKQRKYLAKAPLHIKRKFLNVNLSKDLRKKYGMRNISVRKGDIVKIMKGKFKKKTGKILEVKTKKAKVYVEGMQVKKLDGSKVNIPFRTSNLQIIELNSEDKKRKINELRKEIKKEDVQENKEINKNALKKTKSA